MRHLFRESRKFLRLLSFTVDISTSPTWTDVTVTSGSFSPHSEFLSSSSLYSLPPAKGEHMLRFCGGRVWEQFPRWTPEAAGGRRSGEAHGTSSDTDDLLGSPAQTSSPRPQHATAHSR